MKEWGIYYKVAPRFDIRKDDPNTLCVTTNPKVLLAKLKPIEAAYREEQRAADEACRARILAARDVRDAAIKEALDEQP